MALTVWQRTIVDERGNIQPGAVLQVTDEATSALAAVYKDRDGTDPWPPGTVTADEFGFARFYAAPGRYRIRSMAPAIDWRDVEIGFQDTDQLRLGDGSVGVPSISFSADTDTGIFREGTNLLAIAAGGGISARFGAEGSSFAVDGETKMTVVDSAVNSTVPFRASGSGTLAAPDFSFSNDPDTGVIRNGANVLSLVAGGALAFSASAAGCSFAQGGVTTYTVTTTGLLPNPDNTRSLGAGSNRWTTVYAVTGTINTSDAREKTELEPLTEAEIAAAKELAGAIGSYRWLDAIRAKGEDGARTHIGITVQRVIEIMRGHGLDPFRYAFVCHDEWEEEATEIEDPEGEIVRTERRQLTERHTVTREEIEIIDGEPRRVTREETVEVPRVEMRPVLDADGKIATRRREVERADGKGEAQRETVDEPVLYPVPVIGEVEVRYRREVVRPAGDRYGLRYDQLAMFIARGLEARLAALESAATRK